MEIELTQKTIDAIAHKTAIIVAKKLKDSIERQPEMVTSKEAAAILGIKPDTMRKNADKFPHIKRGDKKQGQLLFFRQALLENY